MLLLGKGNVMWTAERYVPPITNGSLPQQAEQKNQQNQLNLFRLENGRQNGGGSLCFIYMNPCLLQTVQY